MELLFKFEWCTGRKLCTAHAVFSTEKIKEENHENFPKYKLSNYRASSVEIPQKYQGELLRVELEMKENNCTDCELKLLNAKIGVEAHQRNS